MRKEHILAEEVNFDLHKIILSSDVSVHNLGNTRLAPTYFQAKPTFREIPDSMAVAGCEQIPESELHLVLSAVKPGNMGVATAEGLHVTGPDSSEAIKMEGVSGGFFTNNHRLEGLVDTPVGNGLAGSSRFSAWAGSNCVTRLVRSWLTLRRLTTYPQQNFSSQSGANRRKKS